MLTKCCKSRICGTFPCALRCMGDRRSYEERDQPQISFLFTPRLSCTLTYILVLIWGDFHTLMLSYCPAKNGARRIQPRAVLWPISTDEVFEVYRWSQRYVDQKRKTWVC